MISLQSLYERSLIELDELRVFFKLPPPDSDANKRYRGRMFEKVLRDNEEPRISFVEKCYFYSVRDDDVLLFEEILVNRIIKLENLIDKHFSTIKNYIQREKEERKERDLQKAEECKEEVVRQCKIIEILKNFEEDKDLMFDDPEVYTYFKKLEQLIIYQDAIISEDRNELDNLRNIQRICRMQGSLS